MKHCSRCDTLKPKEDFYKKGDRVQHMCKQCFNKYCQERWTKHKLSAIAYLGGKCIDCGNSYLHPAMQFHHNDPSQKDVQWDKLRLRSESARIAELDKCSLLCANCHAIRHSALSN